METDTRTKGASQDLYCTNAEESTIRTNSAAPTLATARDLRGLHGQPLGEFTGIRPRAVTPQQATVLADLALTVLLKRSPETAATVAILCGRMNDLEPEDFQKAMVTLAKRASGSSLDIIAGLCRLRREITVHEHGQFSENDRFLSQRLLDKIERPAWWIVDDQLVGVSIRTALHFRPQVTLVQQEAAIEKTVKAVEAEIVRTQVDQIFRVNDLWLSLRYTCLDVVIDAGAPNRPFEEILLWREGKSEPLIGNYIVKPGERLIVEPSLPAAIDIRPAGGPPMLVSC